MKVGPKTRRFLKALKKDWQNVKKGYGKSVEFVQEYAPRAERGFGAAAGVVTESLKPMPVSVEPQFGPRQPRYVDLRKPTPRLPIKPRKRHDFGKLTFDI